MTDEYGSFGDTTDTRVLAERLDEGLHALDLLWSGEPVTYRGNQVTIDNVVFLPTPCSARGCWSGSAGSGRTSTHAPGGTVGRRHPGHGRA